MPGVRARPGMHPWIVFCLARCREYPLFTQWRSAATVCIDVACSPHLSRRDDTVPVLAMVGFFFFLVLNSFCGRHPLHSSSLNDRLSLGLYHTHAIRRRCALGRLKIRVDALLTARHKHGGGGGVVYVPVGLPHRLGSWFPYDTQYIKGLLATK